MGLFDWLFKRFEVRLARIGFDWAAFAGEAPLRKERSRWLRRELVREDARWWVL